MPSRLPTCTAKLTLVVKCEHCISCLSSLWLASTQLLALWSSHDMCVSWNELQAGCQYTGSLEITSLLQNLDCWLPQPRNHSVVTRPFSSWEGGDWAWDYCLQGGGVASDTHPSIFQDIPSTARWTLTMKHSMHVHPVVVAVKLYHPQIVATLLSLQK